MIEVLKLKRKDKPCEVPGMFDSVLTLVVKGSRFEVLCLERAIFKALQKLTKKV